MTILFYDLVGRGGIPFSSNCWRTTMALAHKGLRFERRPVRFCDIPAICGGTQKTVPAIEDGGRVVGDSWTIANHLEDAYPDRPSLFGDASNRALTRAHEFWIREQLFPISHRMMVKDACDFLVAEDQAYFRAKLEGRFGDTLENLQAQRETAREEFRRVVNPLRETVATWPFLGGDSPRYIDYIAFAYFQRARLISRFALLAPDDPLAAWFERCLDLHGGLGRSFPALGEG